jgi:hypothetical protein
MDDVTARWLGRARAEDASAVVFDRMAAQLIGLDPDLAPLADALRDAAGDERRHAEICRGVAGAARPPDGPDDTLTAPSIAGLDAAGTLAAAAIYMLAAGETVALALLAEAQQPPCAKAIASALRQIEADERRHAELGWALLDALAVRTTTDRRTLARALSQQAVRVVLAAEAAAPDDAELRPWGVLSRAETRRLAMAAISGAVAPQLARRGLWTTPG